MPSFLCKNFFFVQTSNVNTTEQRSGCFEPLPNQENENQEERG